MLANLLSFSRLLLAPPLLYSLRQGEAATPVSLALLFAAATTDLADGMVARRLGQTSRLGKVLDPLADKFFLASLLGGLCLWGEFPAWLFAMLLARDAAIVAAGLFLLRSRGVVVAANRWGKYTTACMGLATLGYILPAPAGLRQALVAAAAALVLLSSLSYVRLLRQVLSGMDVEDLY